MKEISLRYIKGVGPRKEAVFNSLGVYALRDLLYYFPFRYEDRRNFKNIKDLVVDEFSVVKGVVSARNLKKMPYFLHSKGVKSIFEVILDDKTGHIKCNWFNQAYLFDSIKPGEQLIVYGKPSVFRNNLQLVSPEYEFAEGGESLNLGRIIGIYRLPSQLSQKFMRKIIFFIFKNYSVDYPDPLPFHIRKEKDILNIAKSLEEIHFPSSWQEVERARERFIFEELFFSQILVYLRKAKHCLQKGVDFVIRGKELNTVKDNLSFTLTSSQEKVLSQILDDFRKSYPMRRLLQGDVGCGKTVVAGFAISICADSGWQAAVMVPTEVLAYQHKETLDRMFEGLDFVSKNGREQAVKVITSSLSRKEADKIYSDLAEGKVKVIIGTHSLIQKNIKFKKLGLIVIDEQHKFGVAQRALLIEKGEVYPHCLIMSATPIPRSLALSLYGDLDISIINKMPEGRVLAETIWVKEKKRNWVYDFIQEQLLKGRQSYVIYPVIEESQDEELKSLKVMYDKIAKRFSSFSVGMFHGKMKNKHKMEVIKAFKDKRIDVLVSTTVVEVGVNIENATTMVVENPERFGLAQLHQLRGRVQRSTYQPYFILISKDNLSSDSLSRLEIISNESCGFKIAEEDLKLRGPGDFFGNLQHGLPDLKIASPLRDLEILKEARLFAYKVIKSDPYLQKTCHRCIKESVDLYIKKQYNINIA